MNLYVPLGNDQESLPHSLRTKANRGVAKLHRTQRKLRITGWRFFVWPGQAAGARECATCSMSRPRHLANARMRYWRATLPPTNMKVHRTLWKDYFPLGDVSWWEGPPFSVAQFGPGITNHLSSPLKTDQTWKTERSKGRCATTEP